MAKTSYVELTATEEEKFYAGLNSNDRFVFSRVVRKDTLLSRKRKRGVSQRSLLPQLSEIWGTLSEAQKAAWKNAAAEMGRNGWQLFVQDQTIRIINEMAGTATPSTLHQSWIGNLKIAAPADEIKIVQLHPHFYWISKKVTGKKGMYEPVLVTEDVGLPLTIELNYSADLTEVSSPSFAKLFARVWHSYQGVDNYTELSIALDYSTVWKNATATLSTVLGYVVGYELYFHLQGLRGDLYFDNVKATHSSQNWVRDPFCKSIALTFTRAFYQVPKHWAAVTLPDGAEYDTIYKDF